MALSLRIPTDCAPTMTTTEPAQADSSAQTPVASMTSAPLRSVRVWDLPTRLFHWVLALAVVGSVVTAKIGGNATVWHFRLGYLVLGLLLFRLVWGVVGGHWSRFATFVRGPGTVLRYLRGQARPDEHLDVGHNPLGAGSVIALLTILAVQVGTGLIADDEIASVGPLNRFVDTATGLAATAWHKTGGQWIIGLVALHIAAIVFYKVRHGKDLVGPMLRGDKQMAEDAPASADDARARLKAVVIAVVVAVAVTSVVRLGG
jgi:cytochrome b